MLSQQAPGLAEALERALAESMPYVILDGKVFAADRRAETVTSVKGETIGAWYSGKAHRHGGNVQAIMRPDGLPLWAGPAGPGSVHDITAARWHALPEKNPPGNREPGIGTRTRNALLRDLAAAENAGSPAHPALGHSPAHHRQPQPDHRDNPRRPRPHPIRA